MHREIQAIPDWYQVCLHIIMSPANQRPNKINVPFSYKVMGK